MWFLGWVHLDELKEVIYVLIWVMNSNYTWENFRAVDLLQQDEQWLHIENDN